MDELIRLVSEKTGLSEDKAKTAVEMVVNYLKQRLPAPIGEQLNTCLASSAGEGIAGKMKEMAQGVASVFTKKTG